MRRRMSSPTSPAAAAGRRRRMMEEARNWRPAETPRTSGARRSARSCGGPQIVETIGRRRPRTPSSSPATAGIGASSDRGLTAGDASTAGRRDLDDGDTAHGSCRSIPGFDMLEALTACAEHLDSSGPSRRRGDMGAHGSARSAIADEVGDDRLGRTTCFPGCGSTASSGSPDHAASLHGISQLRRRHRNPKPAF